MGCKASNRETTRTSACCESGGDDEGSICRQGQRLLHSDRRGGTPNVEKPLGYEAFKSWSKYGDPDFAERFCHFSGEPSR